MNIVMPVGVLLPELDYKRSIEAFNEFFKQKGFDSFDENKWEEMLPDILELDTQFKYGQIVTSQFREKIAEIFSKKFGKEFQFAFKEFRPAWNAMLGDVTSLKERVEVLQNTLKGHKLILMSATNIRHVNYIFRNAKMPFKDVPVFLTYADQVGEISLYERIVREMKTRTMRTFLVIRGTMQYQTFQVIKDREMDVRRKIRRYIAENKNLEFLEVDFKGDIGSQILEALTQLKV
jgi:hypothetical protein